MEPGETVFLNRDLYMEGIESGEADSDRYLYFYDNKSGTDEYLRRDEAEDPGALGIVVENPVVMVDELAKRKKARQRRTIMKRKRNGYIIAVIAASIWMHLCWDAMAAESQSRLGPVPAPPAPTLSATIEGDLLTLSWNDVSTVFGYRIYADPARGRAFDGAFDFQWDLKDRTSAVIRLWPGADIYYAVTAYEVYEGIHSNIVRAGLAPETPALSLKTGDEYAVLSWSSAAGATGYRIYGDLAKLAPFDGEFDYSWDIRKTSGRIKLWQNADVYYAVTAFNAFGESNFSEVVRLFPNPSQKDWVAIATGDNHTVALKADGTLWSWGSNQYGQLGDGSGLDLAKPARLGEDSDWSGVFAGGDQTFAIKSDGSLWGWGCNHCGQLGVGSRKNHSVPVQIGTDRDWSAVSTRYDHAVALKADGTLWGWGNITGMCVHFSHCGDDVLYPVQIGQDDDWIEVSASDYFGVALKADGTLWVWGGDYLANGSFETPVQIGNDSDWSCVSAGGNHAAALKADGSLWTWGWLYYGAVGNGATGSNEYALEPGRIAPESDWISVHAGAAQTFAVRSDGALWAWGENSKGELADGTVADRCVPVQTAFHRPWDAVSAGQDHVVGLQPDGTLWAWGKGEFGERGDGARDIDGDVPVQVEHDTSWKLANGGFCVSIAVDSESALWTWGYPVEQPSLASNLVASPVQVGEESDWSSASAGLKFAAAIKTDGTLWTWGRNYSMQLGDGTTEPRDNPIRIGEDADWLSVSTGGASAVALKKDRSLWAWGSNEYGQLGDGTNEQKGVPERIGMESGWVFAATSLGGHSAAIDGNGALWTWGYNAAGQLGDGANKNRAYPAMVGSDTDWKTFALGNGHTLAVKEDGTLWAWGRNPAGQLGDGTTVRKSTPVQIGVHGEWKQVAAGSLHSAGVKIDGTLWAWGYLSYFSSRTLELDDAELMPVQIGTENDWQNVSSGTYNAFARKKDGSLWEFGLHCYSKVYPVNVVMEQRCHFLKKPFSIREPARKTREVLEGN